MRTVKKLEKVLSEGETTPLELAHKIMKIVRIFEKFALIRES